jgi:hypothetical protein
MTRFIEEAIARAGLLPVLTAWRAGELAAVRAARATWQGADLLVLGALADAIRVESVGSVVQICDLRGGPQSADVMWVEGSPSGLDFLRAVAVARIEAAKGARIGVDWSRHGLELAQVALGFGASDLRGPITRKSGLPVLDDEARKVKGQGMVELKSLVQREIAALVGYAGREPVFVDEEERASKPDMRALVTEVAGA